MAKPHELDRLAQRIEQEISSDGDKLAKLLFPELVADARKLSEQEYVEYVRQNWNDQQFRINLLGRVGHENFLTTAKRVFGVADVPKADLMDELERTLSEFDADTARR